MIRIAEQNQESTRDVAAALDVCSHRERYPGVPAASEGPTVSRHANCFHSQEFPIAPELRRQQQWRHSLATLVVHNSQGVMALTAPCAR